MRRSLLLAFALPFSCALAQEHVSLPLTVGHLATRDGKVYEGAVIVGEDEVGVKIQHDGGTARVLYDRLPDDLAKQFSVEAGEGKARIEADAQRRKDAAEAARKAADEAAKREADRKGSTTDEGGAAPTPALPAPPVMTQDPDILARIASLEAYIRKLQKGIDDSQVTIDKARRRAKDLRGRSEFSVVDSTTGRDVGSGVNASLVAKANFQDNLADREQAKVEEARRLIADTQAKIAGLRATPAPAPKAPKTPAN